MLVPCCGASFCNACIRGVLPGKCPSCEGEVDANRLVVNKSLRMVVEKKRKRAREDEEDLRQKKRRRC